MEDFIHARHFFDLRILHLVNVAIKQLIVVLMLSSRIPHSRYTRKSFDQTLTECLRDDAFC